MQVIDPFGIMEDDDRELHQQPPGECTKFCPWYGSEHWHGNVHLLGTFELSPEVSEMLEQARQEWARLKAAGTPYWCIHEGREVDHPSAYWKEDGYFRSDGLEMQYKHGVICRDCGGYIQEG